MRVKTTTVEEIQALLREEEAKKSPRCAKLAAGVANLVRAVRFWWYMHGTTPPRVVKKITGQRSLFSEDLKSPAWRVPNGPISLEDAR